MKTAKQWVEESNWSDELKELFWERAEESEIQGKHSSLQHVVYVAFPWSDAPEGWSFWRDVGFGERTDIYRPVDALAGVSAGDIVAMPRREDIGERVRTDEEYETLFRKALEGLKEEEVGSADDAFARGYNTGIREMNAKIDDLLKKL